MADKNLQRQSLHKGQFFGEVARRQRSSGLVLTELRHPQRRRFPRHDHELAYFGFILDGGYHERVAGLSVEQGPLSLAFHPPSLEHLDEVGEGGGRMLCIEIGNQWLERLRQESRIVLDFGLLTSGRSLGLAVRLYRELHAASGPGLLVEELSLDLLTQAVRQPVAIARHPPSWLGAVEERLREGFREPLCLDDLAAVAGVHPVYLSRTFHHFRGLTLGETLQEVRVRHVCAGLTDSGKSLTDLALDAGFADQSHCTRVFKQRTGMTPGAFRTALGGHVKHRQRAAPILPRTCPSFVNEPAEKPADPRSRLRPCS